MGKFLEQVKSIWESMGLPQRVSMALIMAVFAGLRVLLFMALHSQRGCWPPTTGIPHC